jgi:hypothetical protein
MCFVARSRSRPGTHELHLDASLRERQPLDKDGSHQHTIVARGRAVPTHDLGDVRPSRIPRPSLQNLRQGGLP